MNKKSAETKVIINALIGKVKVISRNVHLREILDSSPSKNLTYQNIKNSLELLHIIEKVKMRNDNFMTMRTRVIQYKIVSLLKNR